MASSLQIAAELEALRAKLKPVRTRLAEVSAAKASLPEPVNSAVEDFNEKQYDAYIELAWAIEGIPHVENITGELNSKSEGDYYNGYDGLADVAQNLVLENQRLEQRVSELEQQIAAKEQELAAAQAWEAEMARQAAMAAAAAAAAAEAGEAGGR